MKRQLLVMLFLSLFCCSAEPVDSPSIDFHLFADAASLDSVWAPHLALRAGVGATLSGGVTVKLPISFLADYTGGDEMLLDIGLNLVYHPWITGPFISLSLAQVCLFIGAEAPDEPVQYLHEIAFGYTWRFAPSWYVEPSLLYRDPSDSFPESFSYINDLIPSYGKFRFCLEFGWVFASITTPPGKS